MRFSEAVDGLADGLVKFPPEKKARAAVTIGMAVLLAPRVPFIVAFAGAMLAGAAAEGACRMLADMHEVTLKQAAYLAALSEKAAVDEAGGV